jgi:hypothetical protein
MPTFVLRWLSCVALLAGVGACGDENPGAATDPKEVVARWQKAGLEVGAHAVIDKHNLGEASCARGKVGGVETTLCLYASDEAAKAAQPAGLKAVGKTTGAALPRGPMLLVVADRAKADPDGKTINKITKTFLGR